MAGIYVHIPFCKSRCIYCGFYSTTKLNLRRRYIDAVCREMDLRKDYISEPVSTVYIGGGTPSQLDADDLGRLLLYIYKVYPVETGAEVTVECNPDDLTPDLAAALRSFGVNRVSMGVQTFSEKRLTFLHRRHNAGDVDRAVERLRSAGIHNISIDLMFGFPEETTEEWADDISRALRLGVEHISAYSLMYEEGTPLTAMLDSGKIKETDEERSLAMYEMLIDRLTLAGYEHYEISNFARPGFRSRHNSSYWRQVPYTGVGAAAHSFDLKSRQWNTADITAYMEAIARGEIPMEREELDPTTTFNDIITTALRTCEGIDLETIRQTLGRDYEEHLRKAALPHISNGTIRMENSRIMLTRKGLFISDAIMSDMMIV